MERSEIISLQRRLDWLCEQTDKAITLRQRLHEALTDKELIQVAKETRQLIELINNTL